MLLEMMSQIPAKPQEWVWKGVIPAGHVTLVVGEPGVGKSMFAMDAIARVTRGQRGLSDAEQGEPRSAILFSGEDDFASVVRMRLESAGADDRLVYGVENDTSTAFQKPQYERCLLHHDSEMDLLESYLTGLRESQEPCRLIVIDPANCFLDATDGRQDSDAREMMARLTDLAIRSGAAILLVAKPSKVEKGKRGSWSATTPVLAEAARSVWTIVCDPDEPQRRLLLPVKTNLCETPPGLAFTIRDQRIFWEEESIARTAEQYLTDATQERRLQQVAAESELLRATEWLRIRLREGKVYSNDLKAESAHNDISEKTLRRALILLGCQKGKEKKATGQWYWRLPIPLMTTDLKSTGADTISPVAKTSPDIAVDLDSIRKLTQSWSS